MLQKHIRCRQGDIGRYVFIPGDPARVAKIASRLENPTPIASNREFVVVTGRLEGCNVTVCSTGIGGPSASIAIEELANLGTEYFIRVGSAGGRQEDIPIGSLVIATAAVRCDGTSQAYAPLCFPAIADFTVTKALIDAATKLGYPFRVGLVYTRDAYYVQDEALNAFLKRAGVLAAEQECAVAFVLGSLRGLHVGAILATDSNIWLSSQPSLEEKEALFRLGEMKAIEVAVEAMKILIKQHSV